MIVAGVDVGNSTTEVALARAEPGGAPQFLQVLRAPTTGPKGSAASAAGVVELVDRARRSLGVPVGRLLLARATPVDTSLRALARSREQDLARNAVAVPASSTPSGHGSAAGLLHRVDRLPVDGSPVVAVVVEHDFEEAAALLRTARERGCRVVAVVVREDDAVLIGNRFDRTLPIVDEVRDADGLAEGVWAAVEVAEPGGTVVDLADPLRLAALLDLDPADARAARHAARAVAGERTALVVRDPAATATEHDQGDSVVVTLADGGTVVLDLDTPVPPYGSVTAVGSGSVTQPVLDATWVPLPEPHADPALRRRLVRRRTLALAALAARGGEDLVDALTTATGLPVEVVADEWQAAVLGASTTPHAGRAPFVADLGGGTVDLHRVDAAGRGRAVTTAGAGAMVTALCAAVLSCGHDVAERAKRVRSARVETPFLLHHEDGSRSFLGAPAPPQTLARLVALTGRGPEPLPAPLAPETWRELRQAAKREVLARNVARALEATGGIPAGELLTLVGGCAVDPEVVTAVAAELERYDVAVARGDVLGRHGPRAAVAVGLVLAGSGSGP